VLLHADLSVRADWRDQLLRIKGLPHRLDRQDPARKRWHETQRNCTRTQDVRRPSAYFNREKSTVLKCNRELLHELPHCTSLAVMSF
jgi:hypothetical protein